MIASALGILALFGLPLFVVISALALLAFHSIGVDLSAVIIEMSRLSDTPMLISLPLFIFTGILLAESKAPERLLALTNRYLRWMPGGMAVVSLLLCAIFTAFTGASGITIFALGGLLLARGWGVVVGNLTLLGAGVALDRWARKRVP